MKKVLITGAHGLIAKNTARVLKEAGIFVIGTSSRPEPVQNYDDIFPGVLGDPLKEVFEMHRIDAVVHCAYDKSDIDNKKNAEGTRIWAKQAEKNNVGLQIFMSSISADADALAPYGQKKYEVEKWFLEHHQVVFRLGLVVGSEGLFGRIVAIVEKSPIIPLIDMGQTLLYPSDVDTISQIIRDTLLKENKVTRGKIWYLQQETPVFFVDILREIRKQNHLLRIFIPIPYFAVSILLSLSEKLKFIKSGINTNNLKGFRQVRGKKFKSDLHSLGYTETPVELLIRKALAPPVKSEILHKHSVA